jgi:Tat protein secretion system quality control protein TatD with DNase activity
LYISLYSWDGSITDDFDLVLERARKAGVERMIITGGSLSESKEALELAKNDRKGHGNEHSFAVEDS